MEFTYDSLLSDLHAAYYDARSHKRNRDYQLRFESHLEDNLSSLLGLMGQHSSYNLRQNLIQGRLHPFLDYGRFDDEMTKFVPYG